MSHGTNLLLALCTSETGAQDYLRLMPAKEDFKGENERTLQAFVEGHLQKYGALPAWTTVQAQAKKDDWEFTLPTEAPEPPQFYYDKLRERSLHMSLKLAVQEAGAMLNANNPALALDRLMQTVLVQQMKNHGSKVMNYAEDGYSLILNEIVLQANGGLKGLNLGWPYLDGMTGGLVGGDVVSIIGRPAQGKTFALLYGAEHAWRVYHHVPLLVSMEMKNTIITQRLASMQGKISLTHLKTGQMDKAKQFKPLMAMLKSNKGKNPFYIVDGALAVNVPQIKLLIQQLRPTVLFIDGAYLLRHENSKMGRWEKVTDNAERIKGELAEGFNIPAVISYQFNREAAKKKAGAPGVEDIAYTDAIGQLSSLVLGMMQPDSVETMYKRRIEILKGRSGEIGGFDINWRFSHPDAMNFSQYVEPSMSELSYL